MHKPDPFEMRLQAAVRRLADDADTRVDAVAMAERARRLNRSGNFRLLRRLGLAAVAAALVAVAVLGWLDFRQRGTAPGGPTPTPSPTGAATASVLPDGWIHITGTQSIAVSSAGATDATGHTTGIVLTTSDQTDHPRATGTGTLSLSGDASGDLSVEWGTYRLENRDGAWEGACRGSSSPGGRDLTCWLTGSGGYAGFTYTLHLRTAGASGQIQGLIYRGAIPPEP